MQKIAKYISHSLLVIAALFFLVGLFTEYPLSWEYMRLFFGPSIIIHEAIHIPEKGKGKKGSIFRISIVFLMLGVAVVEILIG